MISEEYENWALLKKKKSILLFPLLIVFILMEKFFLIIGSIFTTKAMGPHSSTLARKIPWMEEPGRLKSMGSLRVGHD